MKKFIGFVIILSFICCQITGCENFWGPYTRVYGPVDKTAGDMIITSTFRDGETPDFEEFITLRDTIIKGCMGLDVVEATDENGNKTIIDLQDLSAATVRKDGDVFWAIYNEEIYGSNNTPKPVLSAVSPLYLYLFLDEQYDAQSNFSYYSDESYMEADCTYNVDYLRELDSEFANLIHEYLPKDKTLEEVVLIYETQLIKKEISIALYDAFVEEKDDYIKLNNLVVDEDKIIVQPKENDSFQIDPLHEILINDNNTVSIEASGVEVFLGMIIEDEIIEVGQYEILGLDYHLPIWTLYQLDKLSKDDIKKQALAKAEHYVKLSDLSLRATSSVEVYEREKEAERELEKEPEKE